MFMLIYFLYHCISLYIITNSVDQDRIQSSRD